MKFCLLILLTLISGKVVGQSEKTAFIDDLIKEGDFYRALTVAKEEEFNLRGKPAGAFFQKKILEIHIKASDFELFDYQVEKLQNVYSDYLPQLEPQRLRGETYFLMGNYSAAYDSIKNSSANLEQKYLFRAFAGESDQLPQCHSDICHQISVIESDIKNAKGEKSESLALALGIIPGMGQVYAGQGSSGLATFVLNSFFIAASIIAFNNNETAFGIATSLVGLTFYSSSIYAGYEATKRYNQSRSKMEIKKLKEVPIEIQLLNIVFN